MSLLNIYTNSFLECGSWKATKQRLLVPLNVGFLSDFDSERPSQRERQRFVYVFLAGSVTTQHCPVVVT